jgi:hypothetical protein
MGTKKAISKAHVVVERLNFSDWKRTSDLLVNVTVAANNATLKTAKISLEFPSDLRFKNRFFRLLVAL